MYQETNMFIRQNWKALTAFTVVFLALYFLPVGMPRFDRSVHEALSLARWYAREHVLLCLIPAFFIAGGISVFIRQGSVMKYLGAGAKKVPAYGVASISGSILAVCSCTVLPLFAGIYRMGAGLGPATAFLYSGPAINVLAIILTARILGMQIGIARAVGAIVFAIVIGLLMQFIFRSEKGAEARGAALADAPVDGRPLWQDGLFFAAMVGILVFANWGRPSSTSGIWHTIWAAKWFITAAFSLGLGVILTAWYSIPTWKIIAAGITTALSALLPGGAILPFTVGTIALGVVLATTEGDAREWLDATWDFAKQILPLLFAGVLVAGLLLGRPGGEGLIPSQWIASALGGNSFASSLFASVAGAFMYFATLTEVPILQGLLGAGMGNGPALALLLAGPALSLPNMLVIRSVMGTRKTVVYVSLVIVISTVAGFVFGLVQ
jgi:uncharacterized protein